MLKNDLIEALLSDNVEDVAIYTVEMVHGEYEYSTFDFVNCKYSPVMHTLYLFPEDETSRALDTIKQAEKQQAEAEAENQRRNEQRKREDRETLRQLQNAYGSDFAKLYQ